MNKRLTQVLQCATYVATVFDTRSFTRAAERLNVHQSAVSHRIKGLEQALGFILFERTTRQLEPTAAGRELGLASQQAIAALAGALDRIETSRRSAAIRLSIPSSLAMKWLIPRLGGTRAAGLDISLHAQDDVVDLAAGEADAAVRFGNMPATGLHATRLCRCWLRPVMSPGYLADLKGLETSQILADRRGETDDTGFSWQNWSIGAGVQLSHDKAPMYFDRADLMLQAAISGAGVALGRSLLVEADIEAGFLVYAGDEVALDSAYWLVATYEFAKTPAHKRLSRWLTRQVTASL